MPRSWPGSSATGRFTGQSGAAAGPRKCRHRGSGVNFRRDITSRLHLPEGHPPPGGASPRGAASSPHERRHPHEGRHLRARRQPRESGDQQPFTPGPDSRFRENHGELMFRPGRGGRPAGPFSSGLASGHLTLQLLLSSHHLFAKFSKLVVRHRLFGLLEHFLLFLVGMMLDQLLQDLCPA